MYSHMPFFINENLGVYCVSNRYSYLNQIKFKPWKLVKGNLNEYEYLDFNVEPETPRSVHCSPVLCNNILNVSCNRSIYIKQNQYSGWEEIKTDIWQGYYDGNSTYYVNGDVFFNGTEEIRFTFFQKILRVVPFKNDHILTGHNNHNGDYMSIVYKKNGEVDIIKLNNGENVYKCNISDDDYLFYSEKVLNYQNEWEIESYKINKTKNFYLENLI